MRRKPLLICREANAGTLWLFCPCSYSRSFHSVFEPEEENICAARLFIHSLGVYAIRFEPSGKGVPAFSLLRRSSNPVPSNLLGPCFRRKLRATCVPYLPPFPDNARLFHRSPRLFLANLIANKYQRVSMRNSMECLGIGESGALCTSLRKLTLSTPF